MFSYLRLHNELVGTVDASQYTRLPSAIHPVRMYARRDNEGGRSNHQTLQSVAKYQIDGDHTLQWIKSRYPE